MNSEGISHDLNFYRLSLVIRFMVIHGFRPRLYRAAAQLNIVAPVYKRYK